MFGICPEPIGGEITIAWESSWIDRLTQESGRKDQEPKESKSGLNMVFFRKMESPILKHLRIGLFTTTIRKITTS